jgi:hypothetical protein
LHLAILKDGNVVGRRLLIEGTESSQPGHARFHETADGKLVALLHVSGSNKLMAIEPADVFETVDVPLDPPFGSFLLANKRAGCAASDTIDLVGHCKGGNTVSYAQLAIGN